VSWLLDGVSLNMEAAAQAVDTADLFARLEASGQLTRIDPAVEPTMYHCAILSQTELETLRRIENVVRMGHIVRIEADRIVLEHGDVPTDGAQVNVDCTASGLTLADDRPIYEEQRITIQQVRTGCVLPIGTRTRPSTGSGARGSPGSPKPSGPRIPK
jgi:hypothetical protein